MKNGVSNLSNVLKKTRELMMYKQTEVAEAVGITVQSYSKYENGLREPSVEVLYKLSMFFKISPLLFLVNKYPLDNGEYTDNSFMMLSIIAGNYERYKWLIERYHEKLMESISELDFNTGYIKKDTKTILKIRSSLYRFYGEIAILKRDLLNEFEALEKDITNLFDEVDRINP